MAVRATVRHFTIGIYIFSIGQGMLVLVRRCESEPPILKSSTTAWGKKQQTLITSSAWKSQKRIAAEEGLVSIAYEGKFAEYDRIYQAIKLMLYAPASGL